MGSRFQGGKCEDDKFELFTLQNFYTDDTVMTIAVAMALMNCQSDYSDLSQKTIYYMRYFGNKYYNRMYGEKFVKWLESNDPKPYNSFGNGSAMRISAVSYVAKSLDEVKNLVKIVTNVTHNHPEGIKGADCIACCILLAKDGYDKKYIRQYVENNYYNLDFDLTELRNVETSFHI